MITNIIRSFGNKYVGFPKSHTLKPCFSFHSGKLQAFLLNRSYSQDVSNPELNITDFENVKVATKDANIFIVDVREPEEIKEHGFIPNSINIPLGSVSSVFSMMPEKEFKDTFKRPKPCQDTEIICYCMIGRRSGMAQQNLVNLGFRNVKNYVGSWTDWASKTIL